MIKMSDINDNEIRIVGADSGNGRKKHIPWWVWVLVGIFVVALVLLLLYPKSNGPDQLNVSGDTLPPDSTSQYNVWRGHPSVTDVSDTLIDNIHLRILTPYNAVPELHVGRLDTADTDIILAAMAADIRRDNGKIVGAYVLAGEPLSWGLSKKGYCAIIDGCITIGVADNSPLFEQATEQGGYFFRQYAAVDNGVMVQNNPQNASFRRALCSLHGNVCVVISTDRILMDDFSAALVKLGVTDAILLVGGSADGWCRVEDGSLISFNSNYLKNAEYLNYIVFRKQ